MFVGLVLYGHTELVSLCFVWYGCQCEDSVERLQNDLVESSWT